jgi:hypothetical protein
MFGIAKGKVHGLHQVLPHVKLDCVSGTITCTTCQHVVNTEPNKKRNVDITHRQLQCLEAFSHLHRHSKTQTVVAKVKAAFMKPFVVGDQPEGM